MSARECQACLLMLSGHSHATIAEKLGVIWHTAISHRRTIYAKLDVRNRAELVAPLLSEVNLVRYVMDRTHARGRLKYRKLVRDVVQFDLKLLHDLNEFSGGFLMFVRVSTCQFLSNYRGEAGRPRVGFTASPLRPALQGVNAAWTINAFLLRSLMRRAGSSPSRKEG